MIQKWMPIKNILLQNAHTGNQSITANHAAVVGYVSTVGRNRAARIAKALIYVSTTGKDIPARSAREVRCVNMVGSNRSVSDVMGLEYANIIG